MTNRKNEGGIPLMPMGSDTRTDITMNDTLSISEKNINSPVDTIKILLQNMSNLTDVIVTKANEQEGKIEELKTNCTSEQKKELENAEKNHGEILATAELISKSLEDVNNLNEELNKQSSKLSEDFEKIQTRINLIDEQLSKYQKQFNLLDEKPELTEDEDKWLKEAKEQESNLKLQKADLIESSDEILQLQSNHKQVEETAVNLLKLKPVDSNRFQTIEVPPPTYIDRKMQEFKEEISEIGSILSKISGLFTNLLASMNILSSKIDGQLTSVDKTLSESKQLLGNTPDSKQSIQPMGN